MSCDREPFYIRESAQAKINERVLADSTLKGTLTIYKCKYCSAWHIRSKGASHSLIDKRNRFKQRKECGDKIKYTTMEVAQQQSDEFYGPHEKMQVYLCRFCHGWHIGHVIGYETPPPGLEPGSQR